ncbi:uncharacterized protein LTR77_010629 [Saxophila tyrrhenica]|uniref:AA1-like domain-containing protein n=1 Tax=Saxophila tyrrhenica TaxID=1690608 RepID=A0AAV9NV06_9PEZI|nr:hypothetical protein LTR77_010629 [Saxophila tyrrhenica]
MFTTTLTLLTLLVTLTTAAANNAGLPFQISNLSIARVLGGNVTLTFTVHDPDPLGKATKSCSGSWVTGSKAYPVDTYQACGNTTFGWHMESYESMGDFVLGLEHSYTDPSVGEPPYDRITNFAKTNMTPANHPCKTKNGQKVCAQKSNSVIKAPIWGTIAKA